MKLIHKLTVGLLIANGIVLCIAGFLLFYPAQLPIVYNEPFPVEPSEIKKGDKLTITMEVQKRKSYVTDIHKNIVCDDGNLVTLANNVTNIPLGRKTFTVEIIIPAKTSLGVCHVEFQNTYYINPLRYETQNMRTRDFKVIE